MVVDGEDPLGAARARTLDATRQFALVDQNDDEDARPMAALSPLTQSLAPRLFTLSALLPLSRSLLISRAKTIHTTLASGETRAEQEFRALRYPQTEPDHSIFEDGSDDYANMSLPRETPAVAQGDWASSRALEDLVAEGREKYEEARAVLAEMQDMKIPIRLRRRYASGALNGLRRALATEWNEPALPDSDRDPFYVFDLWFEHMAPANFSMLAYWRQGHSAQERARFYPRLVPIRSLAEYVVRSSEAPPKLLEHMLLAATRKGYYSLLARLVTTRLAHLYGAEEMSRFLDQLEAEGVAHALKVEDFEQKDYVVAYSAQLWGNAIRKQCNDRHIRDALALLRAAVARQIQLDQFTFRYVLGIVRNDPRAVEEVIALSGDPDLKGAKVGEVLGDANVEHIPPMTGRRSLEENLDIATHYLHVRALAPGSGVTAARAILPLFELAYAVPKTRRLAILQALHSRAHSLGTLPDVLHAHMLFNLRRRRPADVLATFIRYFHPASVPQDIIRERLWNSWANLRVRQLIMLPDKFEPDRQVQALAWGALAHLSRDAKLFEELYSRLLAAADHVRMRDSVSPEAFRHFIGPTGPRLPPHVRTHEFAQRVLRDMSSRGIKPTVRVHATAAIAYLRDGVMDAFTSHVAAMFDLCRAELNEAENWVVQRRLREARHGGVAELLGVAPRVKAFAEARTVLERLWAEEQYEDALGWQRQITPSALLIRIRDFETWEARWKSRSGRVDTADDEARFDAEVLGGAWLGSSELSNQTAGIEDIEAEEPEGFEGHDEEEQERRSSHTLR